MKFDKKNRKVFFHRGVMFTSFFQVTWIDSPNGGHVFTPEKVTNKTPKKVTIGRTWQLMVNCWFWGGWWFGFRKDPLVKRDWDCYLGGTSRIRNQQAKAPTQIIPMTDPCDWYIYIYTYMNG